MAVGFVACAEDALGDEVLAVGANVGPCMVATEQGERLVEAEVSGSEVVVLGLQDSSAQVALIGSVVGSYTRRSSNSRPEGESEKHGEGFP